MVAELAKGGDRVLEGLDAHKAHLIHMVMGISGETGELLDAVKKHVIYGNELDVIHAIEELGDIEFYLEGLRQGLGVSRAECLQSNVSKLRLRYGEKYSNEAAISRADKA